MKKTAPKLRLKTKLPSIKPLKGIPYIKHTMTEKRVVKKKFHRAGEKDEKQQIQKIIDKGEKFTDHSFKPCLASIIPVESNLSLPEEKIDYFKSLTW